MLKSLEIQMLFSSVTTNLQDLWLVVLVFLSNQLKVLEWLVLVCHSHRVTGDILSSKIIVNMIESSGNKMFIDIAHRP